MTKFVHFNFNVLDLARSIAFYGEALGLAPVRELVLEGRGKLVYLGDGETGFQLELTQLFDRTAPYDLGEGEFHLAFATDRFDQLYERHKAMGCICQDSTDMGFYFIEDPDGYWLEIVPD